MLIKLTTGQYLGGLATPETTINTATKIGISIITAGDR
jgi:hypothetical protein